MYTFPMSVVKPYPIRLTPELSECIKAEAAATARSINFVMIERLKASYGLPTSPQGAVGRDAAQTAKG